MRSGAVIQKNIPASDTEPDLGRAGRFAKPQPNPTLARYIRGATAEASTALLTRDAMRCDAGGAIT